MALLLKVVLTWVISSIVVKFMFTLGLAFFTYTGLEFVINEGLQYAVGLVQGLPADIISILAILGIFKALSIVASALTTLAAIKSIKIFVGVR